MPQKTIAPSTGLWVAIFVVACVQPDKAPMALPCHSERSLARRALLIGINDYSASHLDGDGGSWKSPRSSWPSLAGAVNDVEAMREMFVASFGFPGEAVRVLTDQEATREAIFQAIEEHLIKPVRKDGIVVFYYSGHGSQVVNSKSDERDQLDESIVPADVPVGTPDIRDKELRRLFNRVLDRGARLVVVLDSCHSGSGARGLPSGAQARFVERDQRDVADDSDYGPRPEERGALVLSASQDDELAWEATNEEGKTHGAFTWALLKAMRSAAAGESAERVFLRARAWLRSADKFQEPVLAGSPERLRAPLFGGRADQSDGTIAIAVESVEDDATVVLRGGWANGLDVGSELRKLPDFRRSAPRGPRLEVMAVQGLGHSTAKILDAVSPDEIQPGDLFEIVSWVAPQGSALRVWCPTVGDTRAARRLAQGLSDLAGQGRFRWIDDPVEEPIEEHPVHALRWHRGQWQLVVATDGAEALSLGAAPSPQEIASQLSPEARLFVQMPAPSALVDAIEIGPGTRHGGVVPTEDPAGADYHLVGRLRGDGVEYAWVRPETNDADERRSGMPSRSAWRDPGETDGLPAVIADRLERQALVLAKIRAWYELQPPPNQEFPYRLRFRDDEDGGLVDDGVLREGRRYTVVLELADEIVANDGGVRQRYVYVFAIDSAGNSVLLYPPVPWGNIENRFPRTSGASPAEIAIGDDSGFEIVEPFGTDTFFLLTTAEPILNPLILEYQGVRGRGPAGRSALEELLSLTGGTRGTRPAITTSMKWSIERKVLRTAPQSARIGVSSKEG